MKQGYRLDQLLVIRGLAETREKAQRAIMAGVVFVNDQRVEKAGTRVREDAMIIVKAAERFVSRGGYKLEAALEAFSISVKGKQCVDIGASTGGFTDCLLQNGATNVLAIDVGHNQLAYKLRSDPRVEVREGVNVRYLDVAEMKGQYDLGVADVSFISLERILPVAFELLREGADMIVLIKPQFELSASEVGKGGIVREDTLHQKAVNKIQDVVKGLGREWLGVIASPILGTKGNREFLAHLR